MITQTQRRWLAITAAFMVNGALYGIWGARIPAVASQLDLSHNQLGLLLLLLAFGAIVCFPVAGRMADRHGAPFITRVLMVGMGLSMIGLAAAPNVWLLAIMLFVFGACHGGMDVAMNAWGADIERHEGRIWMPSFHAMWSFGAGLGAITGVFAVANGVSYAWHFVIAAMAVPALGFWGMNIVWQTAIKPQSESTPLVQLPKGMLLLIGVFAFCTTLGEGAVIDWSAIYLIEVAAAEEQIAPIGLAVFSSTMVAMRLAGGWVISRFGTTQSAIVCGIMAALGTGTVVLGQTPILIMIGFALMGFGYALAMPIAFRRAGNDPDMPPAQAIASVATLGYGGILLGPPVIGFLSDWFSLRSAFGVLLLLAIVMLIIAPSIRETSDQGDART